MSGTEAFFPLRRSVPAPLPLGIRAVSNGGAARQSVGPHRITTLLSAFIMGIVNVNRDSFWERSRMCSPEQAAETAFKMTEEGADIIDIGAESSRPGAVYISAQEEIDALVPVIEAIRSGSAVPISVDTRKKAVMQAAWEAGADIINDISALEDDPCLGVFAAEKGLPVILMHKKGEPAVMQQGNTRYTDAAAEVRDYLHARARYAAGLGIREDRIILDPGIGFGKDTAANFALVHECRMLSDGGAGRLFPVLIGISRKGCIGAVTGRSTADRLPGTLAAELISVLQGASILRVHDVKETADMLSVLRAVTEYSPRGLPFAKEIPCESV